jgi:hypothetical protein
MGLVARRDNCFFAVQNALRREEVCMNTENIDPVSQDKAQALSSAALARRRMLLKGLGKGGAVLAASLPLATLASESICTPPGPDGKVIRCGISGMASGVGSRETYTTCSGYSPGWWGQESHEHEGKPGRAWPCDAAQPYNARGLFDAGHALELLDGHVPSLFQVMSRSQYSNAPVRHWICAYLNGLSGGYSNFPYSGAEVLSFYHGTGRFTADVAYTFFTTYMETHS